MKLLQAFGQFASSGAAAEVFGWNLLMPSAVSVTGSGSETASIGANGTVTVSSAETLQVEDVFSAQYRSYMILQTLSCNTSRDHGFRLRTGGSTAIGTDYSTQVYNADGTGDSAFRNTGQGRILVGTNYGSGSKSLCQIYVYDPFAASVTAVNSVNVNDDAAIFYPTSGFHDVATSYESFELQVSSGGFISGEVSVYGLQGAA